MNNDQVQSSFQYKVQKPELSSTERNDKESPYTETPTRVHNMTHSSQCPTYFISESLLKTTNKKSKQQIKVQQQTLKQKAKKLKQKLQQTKQKKQVELQKKVRQQMVEYYQKAFEKFKEQIQQETKSQCSSLQLIKQFKLNQIIELEQQIKNSVKYLQKTNLQIQEFEADIQRNHRNAQDFLNSEMQKEKQQARILLQRQKNINIENFIKRISIQ